MFSVDDIRTPRDRVSDEFMRRLLEGDMQQPQHEAVRHHCCPDSNRRSTAAPNCRMPDGRSLAMVYSPCQVWRGIYAPDMALRRGTMFKELDKPWGVENVKGGCGCGK